MKMKSLTKTGGTFYLEHYRDGKLIGKDEEDNLFVDEGLIYALNSAFGVPVGGAPSPKNNFYIGLGTANRAWQSSDTAVNVHDDSSEFELYNEATRQEWLPQSLATSGTIELSNVGAEVTITLGDLSSIGDQVILYSAFLIDKAAKDGTGDATGTLFSGTLFANQRVLYEADTLKIGYILKTESA